MTFLNPVMLAWAGGAAVPLVVHLLGRSRYRTVDWGAMMFLVGPSARRQEHRGRVRLWTLLAVRSALVGTLVLAVARPVVGPGWDRAAAGDGGRVEVAVVLDVSASTGYAQGERTRLAAGRDAAADVLAGLRRGDRAGLVTTGTVGAAAAVPLTDDLQAVVARVADARTAAGEADVAATLVRAADLLDADPSRGGAASRVVVVVCDRQAASWRNVTDAFAAAWAGRRGGPPAVVVCPVGGLEADNLTVDGVRVTPVPVVRDQPAAVEVRVRNDGRSARAGVPVTVRAGSRVLGETTVAVPPRSARTVRVAARFYAAGTEVVSAAVRSGGLTSDDAVDTVVTVIDPVRVLLLTGDVDGPPADGGGVLRVALQPFAAAGRREADGAVVTVRPSLTGLADLGGFDVVALANCPAPTAGQVRDLEAFVYAGGGLLVAPGDLARAEAYDAAIYRDGAGLLPARLSPPTPAEGPATSVLGLELDDPIFSFLAGRPDPLPAARVLRWFPAVPRLPDARVLGTYATGQPFAVAASVGRGRVVLVTTPLDDRWSTLPRSTFFLPFVQSAVRWLAGGGAVDRDVALGQPLVESVDGAVDGRSATVTRPDGRRDPAAVTAEGDRSRVRYGDVDVPGVYRLRYRANGRDRSVPFAVGPDRAESDLTPLADADWPPLLGRVRGERVEGDRAALEGVVAHHRGGRDLRLTLLGVLAALAAVELWLGRRWSPTA